MKFRRVSRGTLIFLYVFINIPLLIISFMAGDEYLIMTVGIVFAFNTIQVIRILVNAKKYSNAQKELALTLKRLRLYEYRSYQSRKKHLHNAYEELILSDLFDMKLVEDIFFKNHYCHKYAYKYNNSYKITYDSLSKKSRSSYAGFRMLNKGLYPDPIMTIFNFKNTRKIKANIEQLSEINLLGRYFKKYRNRIIRQQCLPE